MKKFLVLLSLSFLLTACGQSGVKEEVDNSNGSEQGIIAGEIEPSLTEKSPHVYEYTLKNQTEQEMTFEFTSSQRFDYTLTTKDGKEVFRYSAVTSFLQAIGEETIKQGEELKYEIDLTGLPVEKGDYTLTVWLTPSEGEKYKVTQEVSIEETDATNQLIKAEGTFNGYVDPHSIEVTINDEIIVLQTLEVTDVDFSTIPTGAEISIEYMENELGQYILKDLIVK